MSLANTSFKEAKRDFTAFLAANGLLQPILWVFKEDTLSQSTDTYKSDFWVKLPLPDENEEFAEMQFALGKSRGFGLVLTAFASCSYGLCCSFVVPTDDEDAQYMLMGPEHLKYSFVSRDMPIAKVIRSGFVWKILRWFPRYFKSGCDFVYLVAKSDLRLERLLALIEDYQASVNEAALLFEKHKGIQPNDLARARFEDLPHDGFVDPEKTIEYYYHGIGLCVTYPDKVVDWDFGHDGRTDGFDAHRLWIYSESGTDRFLEFRKKKTLEQSFAEAAERGVIQKLFREAQDNLYYLSASAKQAETSS